MKTKNIKLLSVLILLFMVGCTEDVMDDGKGLVPINLKIAVYDSTDTRAGTGLLNTFSSGEVLGIALSNCVNSSGTALTNTTYTIGTGFAAQPYLKVGYTATIKGYYPSSVRTATSFTVNSSQIDNSNYKSSDLMYASTTATKASPSPTLTFTHKMAKIIVNVTPTDGVSSITSVTLNNINRTIGFTNSSGALGTLSNPGDIAMSNNGAVLLPPQTTSESNNFLTIVTNAGTAYYKLGKTFAGGSVYTLNITVGLKNIGLTTTITGWSGNQLYYSALSMQTIVPVISAVDLGLPSGRKWANCNIGANSETEYGSYFSWGGTEDVSSTSINLDWNKSYPFWVSGGGSAGSPKFSKYVPSNYPSYWGGSGSPDDKMALESDDDAAHVIWGGSWHMPTKADWKELNNASYTTWTWQSNFNSSGVAGWKVTSNNDPSKYIFLPAAGCRNGTSVSNQGTNGFYWSSTLVSYSPDNGHSFIFNSSSHNENYDYRYTGCTVRAVSETPIPLSNVSENDVGKVICSNGHIHTTKYVAEAEGCIASGIIAYINSNGSASASCPDVSGSYRGLAIALDDCTVGANSYGGYQWYTSNSGSCTTQSTELTTVLGWYDGLSKTNSLVATSGTCASHTHAAADAARTFSTARPSGVSAWFLPSLGQWNLMAKDLVAQGGGKAADFIRNYNQNMDGTAVSKVILLAGGTGLSQGYLSSSEYDTEAVWYVYFNYGAVYSTSKSSSAYKVRPCFAF